MKNGNWKPAIWILCVLLAFFVASPQTALANNVTVNSVSLADTAPGNYATVTFNLSQENPFGNVSFDGISFSDYIWVFVKYSLTSGDESTPWGHCILAEGGAVLPENDLLGAFIRASAAGTSGTTFTLRWNYQANGVSTINTSTLVKVCAIEMVYVPTGAFWYNVANLGGAGNNNLAGGATLVNTTTQIPPGADTGWPNGYTGFYLAKYEISQGQFTDFLNTVPGTAPATWYPGSVGQGYSIWYNANASYGSRYTTTEPNRPCNSMFWSTAVAYYSWTALRPMTEMEYEKAARGTSINSTNIRIYPWGNNPPTAPTGLIESALHPIYYCNNNISTAQKPISVGWYLSRGYVNTTTVDGGPGSGREYTGASPYGIVDLAGNVTEHLINCNWTVVPPNGNGTTTPPDTWPAATAGSGAGWGVRGGNWYNAATNTRISSRAEISITTSRQPWVGGRTARSGTTK